MLIDLHCHTRLGSEDSFLTPVELIQRAKALGLDGICLTEHDWFWPPETLARLSEEHGILVVPAVEVTTEEGHLLVFGATRYIFGMHRAAFVRRLIDEVGGAMVVAHPYRRQFREDEPPDESGHLPSVQRACENSIFGVVDAVEILNGRASNGENGFSFQLGERLRLRGCGGSDAHSLAEIGSCATLFTRRITCLEELIVELREGRFQAADMRQAGM